MHFLVLGFVLGPSALGLLTPEASQQLSPLLALGLGWVGFHFGLQLDRRSLGQFALRYHVLAVGQAFLAFWLFLGGAWLMIRAVGLDGETPMVLLLGAAATAAVSTPAGVALVSANFLIRGKVRDLLLLIASLDAIVGILALQVAYSLFRPGAPPGASTDPFQLVLLGVAAALGLAIGIVFLWLSRRRPAGEELVLYVLGMSAFAAGAALQWGLSPLFVSVTVGATVANLHQNPGRLNRLMQRWEKPVYLTFLLLAGAFLQMPNAWVVLLALAYALLRAGAKTVSCAALVSVIRFDFDVPRRLGLGLVPQGGISLAMAVPGVLLYSDLQVRGLSAEAALFSIIVIGVMISELVGPLLTVQLLRRAGELSPRVEAALADGDARRATREALRHLSPETPPEGGRE
jgi:Kef-type K+ transport system membrane component KefB